jgi:type IV secretory pathway VirB10-like protein
MGLGFLARIIEWKRRVWKFLKQHAEGYLVEKIEKQVASGEPEGPLNRYLTKQNVLGVIAMAVFVAGVWIMRPHRVDAKNAKPQQTIVDKVEAENKGGAHFPKQQTPKQDSGWAVPDQGNGLGDRPQPNHPNYGYEGRTAAAPQQEESPMKILAKARFQREVEYAFKPHAEAEEKKEEPERGVAQPKAPASVHSLGLEDPQGSAPSYIIPENTWIPATLTSRIESQISGPVDAVISEDVYLPGTRHIVIPQGAKAIGTTQQVTAFGQKRLAILMKEIQIFPQGFARPCVIPLESPVADQAGSLGATGKVDNHTLSLLLAASVVALIQGASMGFSYGGQIGTEQILIGNMSAAGSQVVGRILEKYTNRPPTIRVPEGSRLKLVFTRDTPSSCEVNQ